MISVTRLNHKAMIINALLIETIEETPDTLITLTTGRKLMVTEKGAEIVRRIQQYLQSIGPVHTLPTEGSSFVEK